MKLFLSLTFSAFLLLLVSCATQTEPTVCIMDAKICPDGTAVGREGPDCVFAECPTPDDTVTHENPCSEEGLVCPDGTVVYQQEPDCKFPDCSYEQQDSSELEQFECSPESREAEVCIEIYQPVCGWSDPDKIQCITYPCAQTYSNSCFGCMDENVLYWTKGECPKP